MKLIDIIHPEMICADLQSRGKMDVLAELGQLLAKSAHGPGVEAITKTLVERERLATTGVGGGIAIPHGKIENISVNLIASLLAILRHTNRMPYCAGPNIITLYTKERTIVGIMTDSILA